jgi:glucosamine--fructose-6-phosphate aminotransferase (isomerizing)
MDDAVSQESCGRERMTGTPTGGGALPSIGSAMLAETREAPGVVARLIEKNAAACRELAARLVKAPPRFAVTCARGSSDSAATYAKYLFEIRLKTVTASVGPSVSSIYRAQPHMKDALFLAVSQSGRSPDIVTLAQAARDDGALTVAIVNDETSPLAALSEIVLPLRAGREKSVAATKSYIASLAAILQLTAAWTGDADIGRALARLPGDLAAACEADWSMAIPQLAAARSLYTVGRGPGFATAQEAALKLKETCGLHAEALSGAELMHGPLTLAGPDFPALLVSQGDESLPAMCDLVAALIARNVPTIVAGPAATAGGLALPGAGGLHPLAEPIVFVQTFYQLAAAVARVRGRDPDRPPHLVKVTETM